MTDNDVAGRDLGYSIANKLKFKDLLWASYEYGKIYPHGAKDAKAEFLQLLSFDPKLQADMRKAAGGDKAAQDRINAIKDKLEEETFKLYKVQGVDLSSGRMQPVKSPTSSNDPLGIR